MKRTIIAVFVFVPSIFLTACTITQGSYYPRNDYVYSVGNFGYRPHWGNFYSAGWGNMGYWRGYRGVYNRGIVWGGGRGMWGGHLR
jgi:hypothetical protein